MYTDAKCIKKAEKHFKCKQICSINKISKQEFWPHHWIKGNLALNSKCYICNEETGNLPSLSDYRCVWCWRNVHDACLYGSNQDSLKSSSSKMSLIVNECDFGEYSELILKPNLLVKNHSHFIHTPILKDFRFDYSVQDENWTPLIIFANKNSGNHDGKSILSIFNSILNPLQVRLI